MPFSFIPPSKTPKQYISGENLFESGPGPKSHISKALLSTGATEIEMKHFAGNSFHLAMYGAWLAYVLAHVKRHPKDVILPAMSTEFGTSCSSQDLIVAGAVEEGKDEGDEGSFVQRPTDEPPVDDSQVRSAAG